MNGSSIEQPGVVNVIFHGLFLFYERKDGTILAIIPDLGEEKKNHVFLAGNWFDEEPIDPGSKPLIFEGVQPGEARFKRSRNLSLRGYPLKSNYADLSFRVLEFPRPHQIVSTRLSPISPKSLVGKSVETLQPKVLPNNQVFTYRYSDRTALRLGDHKWKPVGQALSLSLHIRHEPGHEMTEQEAFAHGVAEFNSHLNLLDGIDLKLIEPILVSNEPPEITELDLPRGIAYAETLGYVKRKAVLENFWSEVRRGGDLNKYWKGRTSYLAGTEPAACAGGEGGDDPNGDKG